jgi:putative membrane protein
MFRFGTSLFVSILCFAGTSAMAQGTGQLTDPQIAHIAYTAGQIDIKAAKQALGKSNNEDVKAFAEDMVLDLEAVKKQALALLNKLNVKPEDNGDVAFFIPGPKDQDGEQVAQFFATLAAMEDAEQFEELSKLSGDAFDMAYAENEVTYHQTFNGALEKTLIPAAQNEELKSLLQTGLKLFTEQEEHAENLVSELREK